MNFLNLLQNILTLGNDSSKVCTFNNNDFDNSQQVKECFEKDIFKNTSNITNDNIKNENTEKRLSKNKVSEYAKKVNDQCQITVTHNPKDSTYKVKCFGVELRGKVDDGGKPTGTWTDGYREFKYVKNDKGPKFQTKQDENGSRKPCDVKFTGFKEVEPSTFFGKITRFFTKPLFLGTFTNPEPQSKNTRDYNKGTLVYYTGLAAKSSDIIQDKNGVVSSKNGSQEECYCIIDRNFNKRIKLKNLPNQQDQQNIQKKQGGPSIEETRKNKSDVKITIGKTQANNNNQPNNQPQDFLNSSLPSIDSISTKASDNDSEQGRNNYDNEDFNKKYEEALYGLFYDPLYKATNNNRLSTYNEQAQKMRDIFYRPEEQGNKQTVQWQTRQ